MRPLLLVLGALLAGPSAASAGVEPDPGFGDDGRVITTVGETRSDRWDVVVPDARGGVLAVGSAAVGSGERVAITRLTATGSRDPAWGTAGETILDFDAVPREAALQSDGSLLVEAGGRLVRVASDGTIDPAFGVRGSFAAIAVDGEDRIVVADTQGVHRLTPNGEADGTFASYANDHGWWADDVDVTPDGKIVVAITDWENDRGGVLRLRPDGTVDPTFGEAGRAMVWSGTTVSGAGVAAGPGGSVVGWKGRLRYRLTPSGDLDPTFDGDGMYWDEGGAAGFAGPPVVDELGRLTYVSETTGPGRPAVVRRLRADGAEDPAFAHPKVSGTSLAPGVGGLYLLSLDTVKRISETGVVSTVGSPYAGGQTWTTPSAVIGTPDDGAIVAGGTRLLDDERVMLARYRASGRLDERYGTDGISVLPVTGTSVTDLIDRPGGHLLVGTSNGAFSVLAVDGAGHLDPLFGVGGVARAAPPKARATRGLIARDGRGRILVAGALSDPWPGAVGVTRLLPTGILDRTFGDDGWVVLPWGRYGDVRGLAVDAAGHATVVGNAGDFRSRLRAVRLGLDGTPDPAYGHGGEVDMPRLGTGATLFGADGSVTLAVSRYEGPADDQPAAYAVARLTATGALDRAFGTGGMMEWRDPSRPDDPVGVTAMRRLPSGKLLVTGERRRGGPHDGEPFLGRLLPDGTPDATFGPGGQVSLPPGDARTIDGFDLFVVRDEDRIIGVRLIDAGRLGIGLLALRPAQSEPPADPSPPGDPAPPSQGTSDHEPAGDSTSPTPRWSDPRPPEEPDPAASRGVAAERPEPAPTAGPSAPAPSVRVLTRRVGATVAVRVACPGACALRIKAGHAARTVRMASASTRTVRIRLAGVDRRRLARSTRPILRVRVHAGRSTLADLRLTLKR